ncbi:MAG: hypothetical protein V1836_03645 [Candidatus Aenigmatarchaeota archaeon]
MNKKGMTTAMLVILGAVVVSLMVLGVFLLFFNEESQTGGFAVVFAKGICGFLANVIGGFGAAICNL